MTMEIIMKKIIFSIAILGGLVSSSFAASWHYDTDGCTKIYAYGYDASECFDKARDIKKEAGRKFLCNAGYVRYCY